MSNTPCFTIDLPVRISEVNYGNHLGHAALASLLHQSRLKLYKHYDINELNIDGVGSVVKKLKIDYQGEAFFDDELHISITLIEITGATCTFEYTVTKNDAQTPVANVLETMAFINVDTRKAARTPKVIKALSA